MRQIPMDVLQKIEDHFHAVIRSSRAARFVEKYRLALPSLAPLLDSVEPSAWWPVPGMYGGFRYWLEGDGPAAKLVSEHWSRVAGGSGRRHEITAAGSQLVAEGFV